MTAIDGSTVRVGGSVACTSGCPTPGAHASWGECARAKGSRVLYANSASGGDYSQQKAWDAELDSYREAKSQGIQPASTRMRDIRLATDLSDAAGVAVDMGRGDLGLGE